MGKWHAYYARRCGAAVCGILDPNLPAAELGRRFPHITAFDRIELLLNEGKPEVLHICAPAAAHEDLIEHALGASIHSLVEKPLTASASSTERLLKRAAVCGVLLNPVHQYVFQDGFLKAVDSLDRIGTYLHFDAVVCSAGGGDRSGEQLNELVADILPHPLAALDRLFPGILAAIDWQIVQSAHGEWRALGEARGLLISILVSLGGRPTQSSLRLIGTRGTLHLDFFHGFGFTESGAVSRVGKILHPFSLGTQILWSAGRNVVSRVIHRESAYPGLHTLIQHFYRAVQHRSTPPLSAEHVIAVARVRDRLTASSI
jgi:predicted dehydrogenase